MTPPAPPRHAELAAVLPLLVFGALALVPFAAGDYWTGQATRWLHSKDKLKKMSIRRK